MVSICNTVPNQDTVNHPAQTAAVSHNHDDTSTLNELRQEHESIPRDTQSTPPEEGVDEPVHPPSTEKPLTMETLANIKTIVQHMTINIIKIIDKIQKTFIHETFAKQQTVLEFNFITSSKQSRHYC